MPDFQEKILIAVNEKDKLLYKYLYDFYYASLCRYASRYISDPKKQEDIIQDVFIKLWELKNRFEHIKAVTSYLYRAVYNSCLNSLRDEKPICSYDEITELISSDMTLNSDEYYIIEEEYFRQVFTVIQTLAPQRREIILLTLRGNKNEEIATKLNISINTVKTLKKKAYNDLRAQIPSPITVLLLHYLRSNIKNN